MTGAELTAFMRRQRYQFGNEAMLQLSIAAALEAGGIEFEREVRLSPVDRIDFLAGRVGIEAKVRYPKRSIYRQIVRYSESDQIDALILITGTALGLPPTVNDKPLFFVSIGRTAL